eukprot:TRINITY_DN8213_c0_g1_i3.p3 TRINITY_DN8213_c0_g1~~TRINITY_DN8213_c0_g1_i3.p3  ORF type:complete len:159 (+),score=64.32 TRINITY_DN8213_c0_g1_i3:61-537(+)
MAVSDHQLAEFREAFEMYDLEGTGAVPLTSLGLVLNSLGLYPTQSTLDSLKAKKAMDGESVVTFQEFSHLVTHHETMEETQQQEAESKAVQLQKAFALWDPEGTGLIKGAGGTDSPVAQFMKVMGEAFEAAELEAMVSSCKTEDGSIRYLDLCGLISC